MQSSSTHPSEYTQKTYMSNGLLFFRVRHWTNCCAAPYALCICVRPEAPGEGDERASSRNQRSRKPGPQEHTRHHENCTSSFILARGCKPQSDRLLGRRAPSRRAALFAFRTLNIGILVFWRVSCGKSPKTLISSSSEAPLTAPEWRAYRPGQWWPAASGRRAGRHVILGRCFR